MLSSSHILCWQLSPVALPISPGFKKAGLLATLVPEGVMDVAYAYRFLLTLQSAGSTVAVQPLLA